MKIAILGTGHLGKIHLKCLAETPFDIVGFYDPDDEAAQKAIDKYGIERYDDIDKLISLVDAVDIVTPTTSHFELVKKSLLQKKHVFVEKPVTHSVAEAEELLELAKKQKVKVQVGHVERYNPAFLHIKEKNIQPGFIEAHRLAVYNPRGTDVSVILDLMIHDIDLILKIVNSEITDVYAKSIKIMSDTADICNARLHFANGCVANITASRVSMKDMRKIRIFQEGNYMSLDFLKKETQIISLHKDINEINNDNSIEIETNSGKKYISINTLNDLHNNAIVMELNDFYKSIANNTIPVVNLEDGYNALALAHRIMEL